MVCTRHSIGANGGRRHPSLPAGGRLLALESAIGVASGLVAAAFDANPDLAAAAHRIAQATARVRIAGADLYPNVEGAGTGSRSW